jgi:ABC-type branched-subunit amino acid transport system substrate-binding protein
MAQFRTATITLGLLAALAGSPAALAQAPAAPVAAAPQASEIRIGLIYRPAPAPSSYDAQAAPEDEGLAGAKLAIQDNTTTGRFVRQSYALDAVALGTAAPGEAPPQGPVEAARGLVEKGLRFIVLALPADEVLAVADALKGSGVVLFNAAAPDDRLRGTDCRSDVFHIAPSRAMQTDALAQFLAFMRWRKLFLITGPQDGDKSWAEAMKRSAKKFGLQVSAPGPSGRWRGPAATPRPGPRRSSSPVASTTTSPWWRTRRGISATTCRSTPSIRGPWSAPRG